MNLISGISQERRRKLEDAIKLFGLCRGCDEFDSWLKEKEGILKVEEKGTGREQMDAMQKKYDVRIVVSPSLPPSLSPSLPSSLPFLLFLSLSHISPMCARHSGSGDRDGCTWC